MKHEYPKWIYPDGDVARGFVVTDAAEHAARTVETKAYSDGATVTGTAPLPDQSPAQQDAIVLPVLDAPPKDTAESVRAALDAAGITYDKRLGLGKLKALLPKY